MLNGKKIVVGVCGGIAAYKAVELVSLLKKAGAEVTVIMTEHAQEFVRPLTFRTIAQNPVYTDMFAPVTNWEVEHIALAKEKDLFILVPATANIIGKLAGGIADDMLTTTVLATRAKVLIAPAMNTNMYLHPAVQTNIEKLKGFGYTFVEPRSGNLACGDQGEGKLADVSEIFDAIEQEIACEKDMAGLRVLVTAGPTKEHFDPVRFLSNGSSGKMGYAIARAARLRGARVTLVSGETALAPVRGVEMRQVVSADEMRDAVMQDAEQYDVIVKAAAVSDFRPKEYCANKIKKDECKPLELVQNGDILKEAAAANRHAAIVGFCMETRDLLEFAQKKLHAKGVDFIVANNLTDEGAGFAADTNVVKIVGRDGQVTPLPKMPKAELAHVILDRALCVLRERSDQPRQI